MQNTCLDFIEEDAIEVPAGWVAFFFEANLAFGRVENPAKWQLVRNVYEDSVLRGAKFASYGNANKTPADLRLNELPNFGLRWEHQGKLTLEVWAKENGMEKWLFPPTTVQIPTDDDLDEPLGEACGLNPEECEVCS